MKITCTQENLKKALSLASKVIGNTSTLPILNNLLLKTESGQLLISSTNLEIAIKTKVGAQIEENGEITVPARTITEYVNNLGEDKLILTTDGTDLRLKTNKAESVIKGLSAEEFPLIPEIKPSFTVTVSAGELAVALSQVSFASAFSETQPELSGILFHFDGRTLRIAATDRYRLAEKSLELSSQVENLKIIIPNRAIAELSRILSENTKTVDLLIAESQILFRTPTSDFISRIIEAQYPDYQAIIPKQFTTTVRIASSELVSALRLSGLFVQDNNNVELSVNSSEGALVIRSTSQKFGSNTTQIAGDVQGGDNQIIFNYRYILDCLNHLDADKIDLKMINGASPAMIIPAATDDYFYLVMPIKT